MTAGTPAIKRGGWQLPQIGRIILTKHNCVSVV